MIEKIKSFNKPELYNWLKTEAGVNDKEYFFAEFEGGLELHQVPEEYVEYLTFIKNKNFISYMNIGIGNGGSFIIESYIQPNLKRAVAVDNTSYGRLTNKEHINQRINWLKNNSSISIDFYNMSSKEYFDKYNEKFDIIFIDGDHSYNGVKLDFDNCVNRINDGGFIVFHDINAKARNTCCPGVVRLWNEIKNDQSMEFVFGNHCGIGIWQKPTIFVA